MLHTIEYLKTLTQSQIEAELSNTVYHASCIIEQLENMGLVYGNGHHAAQGIAEFAVKDLKSRWIQKTFEVAFENGEVYNMLAKTAGIATRKVKEEHPHLLFADILHIKQLDC